MTYHLGNFQLHKIIPKIQVTLPKQPSFHSHQPTFQRRLIKAQFEPPSFNVSVKSYLQGCNLMEGKVPHVSLNDISNNSIS